MKYLKLGAALGARCFWNCSLRDSDTAGYVLHLLYLDVRMLQTTSCVVQESPKSNLFSIK